MPKYMLFALNGPTSGPGDEEKYLDWYDDVHVPAISAIDGVTSARRFKVLRGKMPGDSLWPYMTVYEIETDDMSAVSAQLAKVMEMSTPTLDRSCSAHLMAVELEK